MYLKKVEVFGFKSFMNKLEVQFGDGLTGIIGPNGCGKSNISDAIRWVLGEQNARLLRGETMDDVVFNGTRSRKPLGMAEVSLLISNDSRIFPIDYSEIRVTRRVYRSGVSEYLINKNPCRLKDVKNLFMDTGLGNSSYTLLERNMVDNLLNNTSVNLRFMLEEAAGIMKYKTQEKIAVRKLEATEGDLLRIRDIVSEVEKRVRSLKRQIGRAKRYNELTDEIRRLAVHAGRLEKDRLGEEERMLRIQREEAFRGQETLSAKLAGVEADIESRRLVLREKEEGLASAQKLLDGTEEEIDKLLSEILVLDERQKGIAARREHLNVEIREGNERIRETVQTRWEKGEETEKAAVLIQNLQEELQKKKEENARFQERVTLAKSELLQRKQVTLDLFRGEAAKRNEVGNLETRLANRREREEELGKGIAALQEEEAGLADGAAQAENEHNQRTADAVRLKRERGEAEEALTKARVQREELAERRLLLQGKRESLESTLRLLHKLRSEYEGYREGVRSLLTDQPRPGAVKGVVGELLEVNPPEYLLAFENALADSLQCVLVGSESDAVELLRYLRENEKGWATFLPQERFHEDMANGSAELSGEDGVLGPASSFVRVRDGAGDVVRYLLMDVTFVRDLETAMRLAKQERFRGHRFVTPAGEGAAYPGFLFGGSKSVDEVGVFERRSRIAEIEGELKEVTAELSRLTEMHERVEELFERSGFEKERVIGELDRAVERSEEAARERARLREALEKTRQSLARLREEKEKVSGEAGELERGLGALRAEYDSLGADGSEADRSLREIEAEMVELELNREAARRELSASQVALAEAEGRRASLDAELASLSRREQELSAEISNKREELAQGNRATEEIAERLQVLRRQEVELTGRKEEETSRRDEILREVNRLNDEIRSKEDSIRSDRKQKEEHGETLHRHDLRLQEIKLQKENLLERFQDEFGRSLDEMEGLDPVEELTEEEMRRRIGELREGVRRLGPVNLVALDEFDEENERYEFLKGQEEDLLLARDSLKETIRTVDKKARTLFFETFGRVRENFQKTFTALFEGGEADLLLVEPGDPLNSDIEIVARPGQKRPQKIALLSGGERALTAIAILFALYEEKPSPFCILDELDAPLDDANVGRFLNMLKRFSDKTQFVVITHNRQTMESADYLYGVTMEEAGVSRVVSVRLGGERLSREEEAEKIAMIEGQGA